MGTRILIVDDHRAIREGIRYELGKHPGWEVCGEAIDGMDAIEKAKSLRPDVVVLDIRMPHLGGLEAAPLIKKELPQSVIVILSLDDSAENLGKAMQAGASVFVSKYNAHHLLVPAIERVLGSQQS